MEAQRNIGGDPLTPENKAELRIRVLSDNDDLRVVIRKAVTSARMNWPLTFDSLANPAISARFRQPAEADIVLLDAETLGLSTIALARKMISSLPDSRIVIITPTVEIRGFALCYLAGAS